MPKHKRQHDTPSDGDGSTRKALRCSGTKSTTAAGESKEGPCVRVRTSNVKAFCNVLFALHSIPNVERILMQFSPAGMVMYAKPRESPVIVNSFWNAEGMFDEYVCSGQVSKWIAKERLETLRKKIAKEVEELVITSLESESAAGYSISGECTYKSGGRCEFNINLFEWTCNDEPVQMDIVFNWHVTTSSQQLKANIDFMDDKGEFISMKLDQKKITFSGIAECGLVGESITHDIDEVGLEVAFNALFYKRFMKIVTAAQGLHSSVTISFNPDTSSAVYPVQFLYQLDHSEQQSHFSAYLLPFVNAEED